MEPAEFVLSYWNIRGTTESLRNLLAYLEVNYEIKNVKWPSDKQYDFKSMAFHQKMPHLRHGNFECTQIVPIGKYLCRINNRLDLLGKSLKDEVKIDSYIIQIFSIRKIFLETMAIAEQNPETEFETIMTSRLQGLKAGFLSKLSQHLQNRQWYMGQYISLIDFFLYNLLFYLQGFVPSLIDEIIDNYMTRFQSINSIQNYIKNTKQRCPVSLCEKINQKWIGKRSFK